MGARPRLLSFGAGLVLFLTATAAAGGQTAASAPPLGGIWTARFEDRAVVPGTIRHISPPGSFFQSMMHPEGTAVVFWGRRDATTGWDIWSASVDGSNLRQLTTDGTSDEGGPVWHPDGKHIVWSSARGTPQTRPRPFHIWIMDADGTNARQITTGPWNDGRPCVSPDGKTIVFCSNRTGGTNLWRTDLDGSEPVQLTRHDGKDWKPVFSPDGKQLVYYTSQSPGGRHNLAVMEWPGGATRQPVTLSEGEWLQGPSWTADGKYLFAHGKLLGSTRPWLYLVDVATGKAEPVKAPGMLSCGHASVDRKGTAITFDGQAEPGLAIPPQP
jgi:Tol biopolymer transport system component